MMEVAKYKIADIIVAMESKFPLEQLTKEEKQLIHAERYKNFVYNGNKPADITIFVNIVNQLPEVRGGRTLFISNHFQSGNENWRLIKAGSGYVYKCPLATKEQVMLINRDFNKVRAYLLPKKEKGLVWLANDIIYDFLQVLLINYFALKKNGVFLHSMGIKNDRGSGLVFTGKSGAGKSTLARIWHKHTKDTVLNDDRVIVRKHKGKFFIYGSPWHGEFTDYLDSRVDSAPLEKIFFIYHAKRNIAKKISAAETFNALFPVLFSVFWDKNAMADTVVFSQELARNCSCYKLGFFNDREVIDYIRGL